MLGYTVHVQYLFVTLQMNATVYPKTCKLYTSLLFMVQYNTNKYNSTWFYTVVFLLQVRPVFLPVTVIDSDHWKLVSQEMRHDSYTELSEWCAFIYCTHEFLWCSVSTNQLHYKKKTGTNSLSWTKTLSEMCHVCFSLKSYCIMRHDFCIKKYNLEALRLMYWLFVQLYVGYPCAALVVSFYKPVCSNKH